MGARFPAPVQTGPEAHPASCTMGTGSFPGGKSVRGVTLTPNPFSCCGQERVEVNLYSPYEPYGLYRASVPVQGGTLPFTFCCCFEFYARKVWCSYWKIADLRPPLGICPQLFYVHFLRHYFLLNQEVCYVCHKTPVLGPMNQTS